MTTKKTIITPLFTQRCLELEKLLNNCETVGEVCGALGISHSHLYNLKRALRYLGADLPDSPKGKRGFIDVKGNKESTQLYQEYKYLLEAGYNKSQARRILAERYRVTVSKIEQTIIRLTKQENPPPCATLKKISGSD